MWREGRPMGGAERVSRWSWHIGSPKQRQGIPLFGKIHKMRKAGGMIFVFF
jgi:hypothetical protein